MCHERRPDQRRDIPMKRVRIVWLFCALSCAAFAQAAPREMMLFLLIGQSNMAGRGPLSAAPSPPHSRVFMLTKELQWAPAQDPLHFDKPEIVGVGPGLSFGLEIAARNGSGLIGLVPAAFGGSSLDEWQPGSAHYAAAVLRARAALSNGKLAGILWHQGEADSNPAKAATYARRFGVMIAQLRLDLDAPNLPVIVGETGVFRPAGEAINAVLAGLPGQIPHCAFVSAGGLTDKGDRVHFDSASQRELGQRYARAWLELTAASETGSGR